MSVEWQKLCCFEVKRVYSISNGGSGGVGVWIGGYVVVMVCS